MKNTCVKKSYVYGIILLLIGAGVVTSISIETHDEKPSRSDYKVGLYESPIGTSSTGLIKNLYSTIVMSIWNYEETYSLLDLPKYESTWMELHNGVTVDYNHSQGIFFTGTSPEYYTAINTTAITENDYVITMKIHFTEDWHTLGCILNYIDEDNYCFTSLEYNQGEQEYIKFVIIEDGEITHETNISYPLAGNTDYDFKVKINNTDDMIYIYVNGALQWTVYLPPTFVYVDDDFDPSTPGWGYDHFSSIQAGVDAVAVRGTIFVFEGTYHESTTITKNNITLLGENKETAIIDASGNESGVLMYESNENTISNFTITGAEISGVSVKAENGNATKNTFSNLIIRDSVDGVIISANRTNDAAFNVIINCQISNNSRDGIVFYSYTNSSVCDNSITNCEIYDNTNKGINFSYYGNTIAHNSITECTIINNEFGVYLDRSDSNSLYHNNLINNTFNAYDNGTNIWNSSYPDGGNYWSDYSGVDLYHGPHQNLSGSDGIGDTPYDLPCEHAMDWYPFMEPTGWINEPPIADFTYISIELSVTFNASSSYDPDGEILVWYWTFGDGASGVGETITHNYLLSGTYNVTLTVVDSYDAEDNITKKITVEKEQNYRKAFIFGKFVNLSDGDVTVTIEAVNLRLIFFNPFQFYHYRDGETVTFLKNTHHRMVIRQFIMGQIDVAMN